MTSRRRIEQAVIAVALTAGLGIGLAAGAIAQTQHTVHMLGSASPPSAIQARIGDVIRFVNDDTENHDVFVPTFGFGIDFGVQRPGQAAELRLAKAGRFRVECVFHPAMVVNVDVAP